VVSFCAQVHEFESINGWCSLPNAVPPLPGSGDTDRIKMESAVSSAAASPAPSVASSKDDKLAVRGSSKTGTGDAKVVVPNCWC